METVKKKTIYRLDRNGVEIRTDEGIMFNGDIISLGKLPHQVSYINSTNGREALQSEQPAEIITATLSMWGDEPTIEERKTVRHTKPQEEVEEHEEVHS
jgi:hypothetical protein